MKKDNSDNKFSSNDKNITEDSNIKHFDCNESAADIQETYHEICINVSCKQEYLQDIITQSIADIILEHGDGVEFICGSMIALEK